ncbi:hypothetical protein, partial [Limnospira platensis]|uniref:hypothetical protein n=1 Tax=Limnospira platensis TaxID=118562 RepID=UPI00396C3CCB
MTTTIYKKLLTVRASISGLNKSGYNKFKQFHCSTNVYFFKKKNSPARQRSRGLTSRANRDMMESY